MSAQKTCPQCGSEYELDVMFCPRDGSTLRVPAGGGLEGSIVADRYHILRKLGEGGMGQVYLAEHIKMGRKSAIKVMNPSMSQDPDAIGRFNREAANASRITNNNVAAIYDFGETPEGLIYLAMEYVEGEPLTKVMERTGALSVERAANITRQVAEALNAAHEIGIVHRDLKPDNIMIAKNRDGSDMVKVVDFGIAKAQGGGDGQKVTKTGLVVGTPEYMSPEQLAGDALDGRSDIYTMALVTFHMLTGTLPFPSTTLQESMIMRLTDRPRTLAEMRPDASWPAPVQAALDRALQRKAEDRYQHATDFSSDLTRAVSGATGVGALGVGTTGVGTAGVGTAGVGTTGVGATAGTGGAMPSTAVRNAVATGTQAPAMPNTAPVTTPVTAAAAAAAATTPQAAGGSGSRRGMMLAAAAVVVAAVGAGAYMYLGHRGPWAGAA
ncbi:MAG: serine/threonine protein kinase, partial [Gemmatimonadaceae bacterium]